MNNNTPNLQNAELFRFIDRDEIASEKITAPRYSYGRSVFRMFFKKKINIVMIILLVLLFLAAFLLPIVWPYDQYENVLDAKTYNLSPREAIGYFKDHAFKWCLGTGQLGNSIMYGIWSSAKTSLLLAVTCAAINMTIGILIGAVWGYSKRFDAVMLVIFNIIANVPGIDGFFGATSIERLAAEKGIKEQTEAFKAIKK